MNRTMIVQYGGRAAGAFLAYRFLGGKVPGGTLGTVAVIAVGWLAGGLAGDALVKRMDFAGTAAAQAANSYGSE